MKARPMTKSPLALARTTYAVAKKSLPPYSSPFSRQDFTQAQLFTLLVLKSFFRIDYRGILQYLKDFPNLQEVLEMKKLPHYSTLCYAHERFLKKTSLRPFNAKSFAGLAASALSPRNLTAS